MTKQCPDRMAERETVEELVAELVAKTDVMRQWWLPQKDANTRVASLDEVDAPDEVVEPDAPDAPDELVATLANKFFICPLKST